MNLSDKVLNTVEMTVLEKGLGFVPTNELDKFKVNCELQDFFRKIRLRVFFDKNTPDTEGREDDTGLRPKSTFSPPASAMPPEVLAFENAVLKDISEIDPFLLHTFHNTSKEEFAALEALGRNPDLVIKPADKGGAVVIMNRAAYQIECKRLLSDTRTYRPLTSDPSPDLRATITSLAEHALANGWISKRECDFLVCRQPRTPYFYILPKVHKHPTTPPGRPIVSGIGSILEPLSKFADSFLRPLVQRTSTYLKDTKDILCLIKIGRASLGKECRL